MQGKPKILIIEDDPDILELLEYNLSLCNYQVHSVTDGEKALTDLQAIKPDLVILDIMLPGMSGLDVLKKIRSLNAMVATPIVMVTAKSQESDIIVGLEMGADDYVTKPFSPNELIARIRALLRRTHGDLTSGEEGTTIKLGDLVINPTSYEVMYKDKQVFLTLSEFKLLLTMVRRPGQVFSRDQLLSSMYDQTTFVIDRNVDVHIRAIRKKLSPDQGIIKTVRGVGYKCQPTAGN